MAKKWDKKMAKKDSENLCYLMIVSFHGVTLGDDLLADNEFSRRNLNVVLHVNKL